MNRSTLLWLGISLAAAPACSGSNNFASGPSGADGSTGGSNTSGSSGHTGGSNAGGSSGHTGGSNAGGSNAGGSNVGGSNVGGSNAGGSNAGGSGAIGGGGGAGGGTSKECVGATCTATQVCVAYRRVGGGLLQPDGGKCPSGSHVEPLGGAGAYCAADFAYKCAELVGCFQGKVTCACATININDTAGTCPTGYAACSDPKPDTTWLNSSAQLICEERVP
jgi:hypothetical protein